MAISNVEIIELIEGRFQSGHNGSPQRIVFWIDEMSQFKDELPNIKLSDATILISDQFNSFRIKYQVEHAEPESKFLIYIPYKISKDDKNILADIMHYSKPFFSADRESMICSELNIPEKNISVVKDHLEFFRNAERRRRYARLDLDKMDAKDLMCGMMQIVSGSDSNEFQSILKKVLSDYAESFETDEDVDVLSNFDQYNLTAVFWQCCKDEFGINDETMGGLIRTLFISYTCDKMELENDERISQYISKKRGRIHVFINSMYSDINYCNVAELLSDQVSDKMKIATQLGKMKSKNLVESDAFRCIDEILISRFIEQINSTYKPLDQSDMQILVRRLLLHFGKTYSAQYRVIQHGSSLLAETIAYESAVVDCNDARSIIEQYLQNWYVIDTDYRKFILNYDMILEKSAELESFFEYVENTYNNVFLNDVTARLCSKIEKYDDLPQPHQTDFYRRYVKESDKAVVVIISDGMRFECASELGTKLSKTSRIKDAPKLAHIVSTLPSLTRFGMAALLPNNGLQVTGTNHSVKINGNSTEMDDREKILRMTNEDSTVIKFKDVINMKSEDLRSKCRGKRIVYIYHDRIDGPSHVAENDVFKNCELAMDEIADLITKITNGLSYTKFIITSDHGFLYRKRKLEELDKISTTGTDELSRRFAISSSSIELDRSVKIPLDYLSPENEGLCVFTPDNSGVYKISGAGLNYVHGGLSLQEIVVPVLTVETNKGKVTEDYVGLRVMNKPVIKKTNQIISIWQENGVSERFREAIYELCFEDEDGRRVSDVQTIVANKVDGHDMEFRLKFIMSIQRGTVHLVVRNKNDDNSICINEEYQVQIMFTDLGGF